MEKQHITPYHTTAHPVTRPTPFQIFLHHTYYITPCHNMLENTSTKNLHRTPMSQLTPHCNKARHYHITLHQIYIWIHLKKPNQLTPHFYKITIDLAPHNTHHATSHWIASDHTTVYQPLNTPIQHTSYHQASSHFLSHFSYSKHKAHITPQLSQHTVTHFITLKTLQHTRPN